MNNSLIMSPTPVVGSLPQIGSQIRRSVIWLYKKSLKYHKWLSFFQN
jgi:hypothetical protein